MLLTACSPAPRIIALATQDSVRLYDGALNWIRSLPVGHALDGHIRDFVIAADGASAFAAVQRGESETTIARVRLADGKVLAQRHLTERVVPAHLTLAARGRRLLLTSFRTSDQRREALLIGLDTDSLGVLAVLAVCAGQPSGIAVLSDIERAYLRCTDADGLVEVDLQLGRVVQMRALPDPGCGKGGLAAEEAGGRLFVPCAATGQLLFMDRRSLAAFDSLPIGEGVHSITVADRRARFAVVSRPTEPELVVVDLAARRVRRRWPISGPIIGLQLRAGGGRVLGSINRTSSESEVIDVTLPDSLTGGAIRLDDQIQSLDLWPRGQSPIFVWYNTL